jgi:hypothetical protein
MAFGSKPACSRTRRASVTDQPMSVGSAPKLKVSPADHSQVAVGFPGQGPHYRINLYHNETAGGAINAWNAASDTVHRRCHRGRTQRPVAERATCTFMQAVASSHRGIVDRGSAQTHGSNRTPTRRALRSSPHPVMSGDRCVRRGDLIGKESSASGAAA